jgi:peroxiredoxin
MKDAEKLGDVFVFLSDANATAAAKYAGHYPDKPVLNPATFVIGKSRRIVYAYVDPENYRVRAGADAVLQAVKGVAKDLRRR